MHHSAAASTAAPVLCKSEETSSPRTPSIARTDMTAPATTAPAAAATATAAATTISSTCQSPTAATLVAALAAAAHQQTRRHDICCHRWCLPISVVNSCCNHLPVHLPKLYSRHCHCCDHCCCCCHRLSVRVPELDRQDLKVLSTGLRDTTAAAAAASRGHGSSKNTNLGSAYTKTHVLYAAQHRVFA